MPQQLDNLIFDRTQSDVSRVQSLTQKMIAGTATEAEKEEWLGGMKGAYNASDLNRVLSAVEYLTDMLYDMGYNVSTIMPEKKTQYIAKEIEYIESTGTQYIDTGFKPNQDTRVKCRVNLLESGKAYGIFGSRISYGNTSFDIFAYGLNQSRDFQDDYAMQSNAPLPTSLGEFFIDKNKNVTTINNTEYEFSQSAFSLQYSLYLFGVNTSGNPNNQLGALRLYSCQIYDNGTLVRDYKPYYDENGVACLYDAVNGKYAYNAGTGQFTASEQPTTETNYWFDTDIPVQSQMETYIQNIQTLRDCLPYVAPDAPGTMQNLTFQNANAIEEILYILESVLLTMQENFKLRQSNTLFMIAGGVFNNV